MAVVRIKIKGVEELRRRVRRSPQSVGKHISLAMNRTVDSIIGKTRPITPVKTGRLVGSFSTDSIRARPNVLLAAVRSLVPYSGFVHDKRPVGQSYRNPSKNKAAVAGFLIVGVDRAESEIERHFRTALNKIVNDLGD